MREIKRTGVLVAVLGLVAGPARAWQPDEVTRELLEKAKAQVEQVRQDLHPGYVARFKRAQATLTRLRRDAQLDQAIMRVGDQELRYPVEAISKRWSDFEAAMPSSDMKESADLDLVSTPLWKVRRHVPEPHWEPLRQLAEELERLKTIGSLYLLLSLEVRFTEDGAGPFQEDAIRVLAGQMSYRLPQGLMETLRSAGARTSTYRGVARLYEIYNRDEIIDGFWYVHTQQDARAAGLDIGPAISKLKACKAQRRPVCRFEPSDVRDRQAEWRKSMDELQQKLSELPAVSFF